jgi:hypothetical protein
MFARNNDFSRTKYMHPIHVQCTLTYVYCTLAHVFHYYPQDQLVDLSLSVAICIIVILFIDKDE